MTDPSFVEGPLHVRGRGLPDGEPVQWWIVDGVPRAEPVKDAHTVWDGGWISPGLVDAHCHVGLGPHGAIELDEAIAQAETDHDAGALLLRDYGSPLDTRILDSHHELPGPAVVRRGTRRGRRRRPRRRRPVCCPGPTG